MSGNGKTYRAALEKVDRSQRYPLEDSLRLAKETARANSTRPSSWRFVWASTRARPIKTSVAP